MLLRTASALIAMCAIVSITRAQDCAPPAPGPRSLLKTAEVIFAGTLETANPNYVFRVTETFKGKAQHRFELLGWGKPLESGVAYLVFADTIALDDGKHYYTGVCSPTERLDSAQAMVKQLRAEMHGRRVASVYGMLWQRTDYISAFWDPSLEHPLPGIVVKLQSNKETFQATTDQDGVYAFGELPPGKYQASADLPPGLVLADTVFEDPIPPFELPRRSSYDYELSALPTGRIRGYVVGPDRKPLQSTFVDLYRAGQFAPEKDGVFATQTDGKPFEFIHLPPGDYVLVFDPQNLPSPDAPFARTFYPDAADAQNATSIHLSNGQQILDSDIHVKNPIPTRRITVQLRWGDNRSADFYRPQLLVAPSGIGSPYPFEVGLDTYTLNLFLDKRYTIQAEAICQMPAKGKVETNAVTVEGRDISTSEVTLTFSGANCSHN